MNFVYSLSDLRMYRQKMRQLPLLVKRNVIHNLLYSRRRKSRRKKSINCCPRSFPFMEKVQVRSFHTSLALRVSQYQDYRSVHPVLPPQKDIMTASV